MAVSAITSIKNLIGYKGNTRKTSVQRDSTLDTVPTVGFRVGYQRGTTKLKVRVLGARHLPAKVNRFVANGYSVKVKLFPGRDKFETKTQPESWPTYNEDFHFEITNYTSITKKGKPLSEILTANNFLVFTVYAEDSTKKKRVIGAATWPLDHSLFTHKLNTLDYGDNEEFETPDIWRKTQDISSGITGANQAKSERNNQFEIAMRYTKGSAEEGETDKLLLRINKLRWSLETIKECEHKNVQLYVKLNLLEDSIRSIKSCKTKRFSPNISVHFNHEKDNSSLIADLPSNREDLSCQISLCSKAAIGKKIVLGRVTISSSADDGTSSADHWNKIYEMPNVTVTQWHSV